eukprot:GGOE01002738.1.p1 GENE.GGOE01002738.1~~GGOE01002738.1.p1  ORF type:complete len:240 (-),score=26.64 GGOE01002738.1:142-861(-)
MPLWPSARHAHTAVMLDRTMLVFGGFSHDASSMSLGDFWVYWPATNSWELLDVEGGPTARGGHAAAAVPSRQSMVIFGGASCPTGCHCHGDLWEFSLSSGRWSPITSSRKPPPARFHHSLVLSEDCVLYLTGGRTCESRRHFSDVWKLDLKLLGKSMPSANGTHGAEPSFRTIPPWPRLRPRANQHLKTLRMMASVAGLLIGLPVLVSWLRSRRETVAIHRTLLTDRRRPQRPPQTAGP